MKGLFEGGSKFKRHNTVENRIYGRRQIVGDAADVSQ